MKRLQSFLLIIALLFSIVFVQPATLSLAATTNWGDGDNNGKINAGDALIVLKVAVGKQTVEDDIFLQLDVDASGKLNANDALYILRYAVQKISRFPADQGTILVEDDTQWLNMSMDEIVDTIDGETPSSAITDAYNIHSDGGLIYNPLSREMDNAEKTKYNASPKKTGTLKLKDGATLSYSLPTDVTAYDMIPISYTLKKGKTTEQPLYVEATTFENKDGSYYDLCLPGDVSVNVQYEGYVAATADISNRPYLSPYGDSDVTGKQYPQYDATKLVKSDTVKKADYLWFKFKITNNGNTILDADGNGTFCLEPVMKSTDGETEFTDNNVYLRITEDLYPGESTSVYVFFKYPSGPNNLPVGEYNISLYSVVRNEESNNAWGTKIWGGYRYCCGTQKISIGEQSGTSIENKTKNEVYRSGTRNTWLHTYEEFTTSYDSWLKPYEMSATEKGVLYVQPAAWSDRVVLKFMQGNTNTLVSATIPLNVETDSLSVKLNPTADNYIVTDQGTKYPAMAAQSMCDMRVSIAGDPDAAAKQLDELLDMKECGVNLVTTTEAFNVATTYKQSNKASDMQDSNWFMGDIIRKLGMRMEGYTSYPYGSSTAAAAAFWYTKDPTVRTISDTSYGNPLLAKAEALRGLSQFTRWGNNFYINSKNQVVFNTEDTRGWMRIDIENRHLMGETSLTNFRNWLKDKYGTIEALNEAWDMGYTKFEEIDPELYAGEDHGGFSLTHGSSDFGEWTVAANDLDIFRTLERAQNYTDLVNTMKTYSQESGKTNIPSLNASVGIRTEGGNVTGVVPYDTTNSHFRHVYYSQRRCALIPQILAKSGVVSMHSDYVTMPYTPSEWATLISSSTALGITSMPLLQSNRMRDIAINRKHTSKVYDLEYNLEGANLSGVYINTQTSIFQAFKAIYENGGIPGVLWEDYLCDGYVTETQQKEMKFFSSKIAQMMQTEEAKAWATTNVQDVQSVYSKAVSQYSYNEAFLDSEIERAMKNR